MRKVEQEAPGPLRKWIANGLDISEQDKMLVSNGNCHAELTLGREEQGSKASGSNRRAEGVCQILLLQCTFRVRYGQPLDRTYEESKLSVPGVVSLKRKRDLQGGNKLHERY